MVGLKPKTLAKLVPDISFKQQPHVEPDFVAQRSDKQKNVSAMIKSPMLLWRITSNLAPGSRSSIERLEALQGLRFGYYFLSALCLVSEWSQNYCLQTTQPA